MSHQHFASFCKKCHRSIIWTTTRNGKQRPVDAAPNPEGNIVLRDQLPDGTYEEVVLGKAERAGWRDEDGDRYMPHHATCPFASDFRR